MIVVTTPTGRIGHQVLANLLDNAEPRSPHSTTPPASASGAKKSSSQPSWVDHQRDKFLSSP